MGWSTIDRTISTKSFMYVSPRHRRHSNRDPRSSVGGLLHGIFTMLMYALPQFVEPQVLGSRLERSQALRPIAR